MGSYYATWGIYDGRKYWPADVPVERLSEVYIAFAAICGSNPGANNGGKSLEKFYADSHDNTDVGSGWPAACPNQGASWEQNSWTLIGSTDEFTVLGAWETNDDGGTGDGGAGDGGTGDSNAWVPGQVYATAGAEVSHNGRTWTNSWWTNGEPGIDPAWTITSAINNGDAWIPGHAYETAGAEVSHNGKLYRNQW